MTPIHGGYGAGLARRLGIDPSRVLDLSASLNPVAPDPLPVVSAHLESLRSYPDSDRAERSLASVMGVDPDLLVLTNGGAEAIALVAAEYPSGWVDEPEFALYRRHLASIREGHPVWRSNPHNPTGLLAPPDATAAVWDEAFWPLSAGTWTRGDSGATVVGSLTKLLACPGLRIGYILCPDRTAAARLRLRRPQWSVNGLVCAALPDLLEAVDLPKWAVRIRTLRGQMADVLFGAGYPSAPSQANWLLVDGPDLEERLSVHAICVRNCSSFGLPGKVRIAVPGPEGLDRLARALGAGR